MDKPCQRIPGIQIERVDIAGARRPMVPGMTQAERILWHLREGSPLTAISALRLVGCNRLAARIHDLRRAGHDIRERRIKTDGGAHVSEYYLPTGQGELF